MKIAINSGTAAHKAPTVSVTEWPSGAEIKRRLSMLEAGHSKTREDLRVFWSAWQQLTDQVHALPNVKGDKGDKGDPGPKGEPGQPDVVFMAPNYQPGLWYRFWRRWLLGVKT